MHDIERLREHLGIERWIVVGICWGVTLGLIYAERYPERVLGMVPSAVTTDSRRAVAWITRDMGRIFSREWACFATVVPEAERGSDLSSACARLLADSDPRVHERAALESCRWEDVHVSFMPGWEPSPRFKDPQLRVIFARLVTHYWSHSCFLTDGEVLPGMHHLAGGPGVLIHGRWDISGLIDTAWALHRAWPGSKLVILNDAGRGGTGFPEAMTATLNGFRDLR